MIGGRAARALFCSPSILASFSSIYADASTPIHVLQRASLRSAAAGAEEGSAVPTARVGAVGVLQAWGCSDEEVALILARQPSIARMNPGSLQSKLQTLRSVGLDGPDLVRIVSCRPRFLAGRIGDGLDARLDFLSTLFQSKGELLRAVSRNPSLLSYDVDRVMRPCVALYEEVGVGRRDLGKVLLSRPTVICRSVLDDEKRELIRRTGLPHSAATYKYAVSVLAISHLETIREKLANLEKFGFSVDQVLGLFGRTPNLLTLSVEKVQRNMTYVVGTMKLPATTILQQPFLVFANLETVLKPRFLLGGRLKEMGLEPQVKGQLLIRALRMTEERFLKHFVDCHEGKVAKCLMAHYLGVKGVKRLAEASKCAASHRKGFPF